MLVDAVIEFAAQYLLFIMVAGFAVFWLLHERRFAKVRLGAAAVGGLLLTLAFIYLAGKLHSDPRPFVQNPALHPLIPHARDNGFPSDHSAAAGLIAALVAWRSRAYGLLFAIGAVAVAAARVAAHLHHVQDVAAGLALGVVAAAIAIAVVSFAAGRLPGRLRLPPDTPGQRSAAQHAAPRGRIG
jgi:membrane-associated phospholipid phosphatase